MTEAERQFLTEHLDQLWSAFVLADPDLADSTCGCCEVKREFLKKMRGETAFARID